MAFQANHSVGFIQAAESSLQLEAGKPRVPPAAVNGNMRLPGTRNWPRVPSPRTASCPQSKAGKTGIYSPSLHFPVLELSELVNV